MCRRFTPLFRTVPWWNREVSPIPLGQNVPENEVSDQVARRSANPQRSTSFRQEPTRLPKLQVKRGTRNENETEQHTAHPGTLTRLHARNRILKHQSPRSLRALSLPYHSLTIILIRANRTPQRARSRKEHIRERLSASCAVVAAAHDVLPKAPKDVLQMRRLALVITPHGASGDGNGHAMRGEVRD